VKQLSRHKTVVWVGKRGVFHKRPFMEQVKKAPGQSLQTQGVQALLLRLAYNLYRLRPCPPGSFVMGASS
jgi:hypothetical protein